jgi:phosphohistidine phosphatase
VPTTQAPGKVLIESGLYAATASELIERLRRVPPGTASVMLIGHNPALHTLVATLAHAEEKFPTGALATLTFTGTWSELGDAPAELTGFVRPRDLG